MQEISSKIRHRQPPVIPCYVGSETPCPGCDATQWHVGRQTAECANCGTPLLLADGNVRIGRPLRLAALRNAWRPFVKPTGFLSQL